jgi:amino acid transporter
VQLRRALGLPGLVMSGVGVMIGAGIYSVIGVAAGKAGPLLWLSFVLGAIPAVLAALNYAELIARFPRVGAEYMFLREGFPDRPWAPFGVGFLMAFANAATTATVALAFAGYLGEFLDVPQWLGALVLVLVCTLVNLIGVRESAWIITVCTLIEIAGLVLVAVAGVRSGRFAEGVLGLPHAGVFSGAALIFFVYTGFEAIVNLAEESERPSENLPRALLWSGVITLVLYLLVALAVVALAQPSELAASGSPLSHATRGSPWMAASLAAIALFSTGNTALITLVASSRILLGMAREGDMPRPLAHVLPATGTPWVAALVMCAAALALLPVGAVAVVGSASSLATLLAFAAVALAVIALRRRDLAGQGRARRGGGVLGAVPSVPLLTIVATLALMTQFPPEVFAIAAAPLALGAALALSRRRWSQPS